MRKIFCPVALCNIFCVFVFSTDTHEAVDKVAECLEKETCVESFVVCVTLFVETDL